MLMSMPFISPAQRIAAESDRLGRFG